MKRVLLATSTIFLALSGTVWAADGAAVYEKKCKTCHSIAGAGGPMAKMGGPLDGVGAAHDTRWTAAVWSGTRQLLLGFAAAGASYVIGHLVGVAVTG